MRALTVLAVLGLASQAAAESATLREGIRQFSSGEYEASLATLREAKEHTGDRKELARISLYTAFCLQLLGRQAESDRAMERALAQDPELSLDPRRFKRQLLELVERARRRLSEIRIDADLPGAVVAVDGVEEGKAPLRIWRPAGAIQVVVTRGNRSFVRRLNVAAGERMSVSAVLAVPKAAERPPTFWQRRRIWTWASGGVAAASLVAGIGLWASATSSHSSWKTKLDAYTSAPSVGERDRLKAELETEASSIRHRVTAANVMYAVAGGLAVTAVVLLFLEGRPHGGESRPAVGILLLPSGGGVVGRF
jgi:hypothetical protein